MLSDALQALRTLDVFAAYRVSVAAESGMRLYFHGIQARPDDEEST